MMCTALAMLSSPSSSYADSVLQVGTGWGQDGQPTGTVNISASNIDNGGASQPGGLSGGAASPAGSSGTASSAPSAPSTPSCGLTPAPVNVLNPSLGGLAFSSSPGQGVAANAGVAVIQPGTPGSWYLSYCNTSLPGPLPVFIPAGPGGGAPAPAPPPPSPAQLAQIAYGEIQLTPPGLQLSPSSETNPAIDQIVNAPTWAWVPAGSWKPLSATAAAGPVVVTATATPSSINVTYGDGSGTQTASCVGPGTPYSDQLANHEDPGAPLSAASPDCGWTYQHVSAGAPGGKEPVNAVVTYQVAWTVTGAAGGGNLGPLNSPPTIYDVPVGEIQVVNTN